MVVSSKHPCIRWRCSCASLAWKKIQHSALFDWARIITGFCDGADMDSASGCVERQEPTWDHDFFLLASCWSWGRPADVFFFLSGGLGAGTSHGSSGAECSAGSSLSSKLYNTRTGPADVSSHVVLCATKSAMCVVYHLVDSHSPLYSEIDMMVNWWVLAYSKPQYFLLCSDKWYSLQYLLPSGYSLMNLVQLGPTRGQGILLYNSTPLFLFLEFVIGVNMEWWQQRAAGSR